MEIYVLSGHEGDRHQLHDKFVGWFIPELQFVYLFSFPPQDIDRRME